MFSVGNQSETLFASMRINGTTNQFLFGLGGSLAIGTWDLVSTELQNSRILNTLQNRKQLVDDFDTGPNQVLAVTAPLSIPFTEGPSSLITVTPENEASVVSQEFIFINGVAYHPYMPMLYIGDSITNQIYAYDVNTTTNALSMYM